MEAITDYPLCWGRPPAVSAFYFRTIAYFVDASVGWRFNLHPKSENSLRVWDILGLEEVLEAWIWVNTFHKDVKQFVVIRFLK